MSDDWVQYLLRRRDTLCRIIPYLESRETIVTETRDGQIVDVTADNLTDAQDNLAEVERILANHGIDPNA